MRTIAVFSLVAILVPRTGVSQTWNSTFVGSRGQPGSASFSDPVWTINGGGADVWDRSDAFQFLHMAVTDNASVTARIDSLDNTDAFAKAGVMVRANLDSDSPTAILDVKPDGGLEFMARTFSGDAVSFISGGTYSFPVWLTLTWNEGSVRAWASRDGTNWSFVNSAAVSLPASFEAGVAVTSHDTTQLTTAAVQNLSVGSREVPGWWSTDVGDVGKRGGASETNGIWTVGGGGADIWGSTDAFHYVYRLATGRGGLVQVRITDLQNTSSFAKAGVMIRTGLDAGAATVLLDVRPTGDVEFMARSADGAAMEFLGTVNVTLPVWLRLMWSPGQSPTSANVSAFVSQDRMTWTQIAQPASLSLPPVPGIPLPPNSMYPVGIVVTSHDVSALNTAHFDGLSVISSTVATTDDIGAVGLVGNLVNDNTLASFPFIVTGAGSDIWGTADSFQAVHFPPEPGGGGIVDRVDIDASNPFAKAGFMYRDGLAPDAAMVILDLKPDGAVEFMARQCTGCAVTFLGSTNIGVPAWFRLTHTGTTFSATVMSADKSRSVDLGSVTVPMSVILPALAVTSHDPSQTAVGIFSNPQQ